MLRNLFLLTCLTSLLTIFTVTAGYCAGNGITYDDSVSIASAEAKKLGLDASSFYMTITANDLPHYMTFDSVAVTSGYTSMLLKKIGDRNFYSVNLQPKNRPTEQKLLRSKDVCFFIIKDTGELISVYREKDLKNLPTIDKEAAVTIANNYLPKLGFNPNEMDFIIDLQNEWLNRRYVNPKLDYELRKRNFWPVCYFPKGGNPNDSYVAILIDGFTGDVIGTYEFKYGKKRQASH